MTIRGKLLSRYHAGLKRCSSSSAFRSKMTITNFLMCLPNKNGQAFFFFFSPENYRVHWRNLIWGYKLRWPRHCLSTNGEGLYSDINLKNKLINFEVPLPNKSKYTKKAIREPSNQLQNCVTFKGRVVWPLKWKCFIIISVITRVTPILE